jgi:hypothetical protein
MSGPSRGTVSVTTSAFDETMSTTHTVTIVFSDPPADETLSSTALIGGGLGGLAFLGAVIFLLRGRASHEEDEDFTLHTQAGPPVSTLQAEKSVPELDETEPDTEKGVVEVPTIHSASPQLPEGGLPPGWTQEQWQYYGQQYLDGTL